MFDKIINDFTNVNDFCDLHDYLYMYTKDEKEKILTKKEKDKLMHKWYNLYGIHFKNLKVEDLLTNGATSKSVKSSILDINKLKTKSIVLKI